MLEEIKIICDTKKNQDVDFSEQSHIKSPEELSTYIENANFINKVKAIYNILDSQQNIYQYTSLLLEYTSILKLIKEINLSRREALEREALIQELYTNAINEFQNK